MVESMDLAGGNENSISAGLITSGETASRQFGYNVSKWDKQRQGAKAAEDEIYEYVENPVNKGTVESYVETTLGIDLKSGIVGGINEEILLDSVPRWWVWNIVYASAAICSTIAVMIIGQGSLRGVDTFENDPLLA